MVPHKIGYFMQMSISVIWTSHHSFRNDRFLEKFEKSIINCTNRYFVFLGKILSLSVKNFITSVVFRWNDTLDVWALASKFFECIRERESIRWLGWHVWRHAICKCLVNYTLYCLTNRILFSSLISFAIIWLQYRIDYWSISQLSIIKKWGPNRCSVMKSACGSGECIKYF